MLLTLIPLIISKCVFFSVQKSHCDFCTLALLFALQGYEIIVSQSLSQIEIICLQYCDIKSLKRRLRVSTHHINWYNFVQRRFGKTMKI